MGREIGNLRDKDMEEANIKMELQRSGENLKCLVEG
jgi:hypothetical protein